MRIRIKRLWAGAVLAVVIAGLAAWFRFPRARSPDDPPSPPEHVEPVNDTYALLVGCTDYPVLEKLSTKEHYESSIRLLGPGNDVELMFDVLRRYLGVPEANITRLSGWDPRNEASRPTRANILHHLDRLAHDVPRGAHVLVLFSGHGSQRQDRPGGDVEADGLDEIFLPADAGGWDPDANDVRNVISDDEIGAHLTAIRNAGADVWAVLDCCHSATMLRGVDSEDAAPDLGEVRVRWLDPESLGIPPDRRGPLPRDRGLTSADGVEPAKAPPTRGLAMISAVQSSQQAPEFVLPLDKGAADRKPHGFLTFEVARTLQKHLGEVSLAELYDHVQRSYARIHWRGVRPYAEGDLSLRAMPSERGAGSQLLIRREGGRLVLDSGSLRGLTVGSHVDVYRRGGFKDPSALLGRLTLTEVEPMRSICTAEQGGPDPKGIPDGAPCQIADVAPGGPPLRIALVDEHGAAVLGATTRALDLDARARAQFPVVAPPEADWLLRGLSVGRDRVARYVLSPARPASGIEPLEVAADQLTSTLERVGRAEGLRGWAASGPLSRLPAGVTAEVMCRRWGANDEELLGPGASLLPGDKLRLQIENGTEHAIDVAVRSISTSQRDKKLWPTNGSSQEITSEEDRVTRTDWWVVEDDGTGRDSLLLVVATRSEGAGRLDLGELSGAAVEMSPDTLPTRQGERALLGTIAPSEISRDVADRTVGSVSVREFSWTTTWGRFDIETEWLSEMVTLDPPAAFTPTASGAARPPGRDVIWRRARVLPGNSRTADVLLLSGDGATTGEGVIGILVDENGDARLTPDDPAAAARRAVAGTLPVELMVVLEPGRSSAAYPRSDGDVALGLVRAGSSSADRADRRFELVGDEWEARVTCGPWLSTSYVPGRAPEMRSRIVSALRLFCRPR